MGSLLNFYCIVRAFELQCLQIAMHLVKFNSVDLGKCLTLARRLVACFVTQLVNLTLYMSDSLRFFDM